MTRFEIRYGIRTVEIEVKLTLEEFVEELSWTGWYILKDEPIAIQVKTINSVKELK